MNHDSSRTKCQHFTLSIARPHLFLTTFSQFQISTRHCNHPFKSYRASFGMPFSNFYTHALKQSHDNKFLNWCRLVIPLSTVQTVWVPFCELWTSIVFTIVVIAQNFLSSSIPCGDCLHCWTCDRWDGCSYKKTVQVLLNAVGVWDSCSLTFSSMHLCGGLWEVRKVRKQPLTTLINIPSVLLIFSIARMTSVGCTYTHLKMQSGSPVYSALEIAQVIKILAWNSKLWTPSSYCLTFGSGWIMRNCSQVNFHG